MIHHFCFVPITGVSVVKDWPQITESDNVVLGQVAGVAVDGEGNIHIFHRGPTVWNSQ